MPLSNKTKKAVMYASAVPPILAVVAACWLYMSVYKCNNSDDPNCKWKWESLYMCIPWIIMVIVCFLCAAFNNKKFTSAMNALIS